MSLEYLEHEQSVLGSMMIDPECLADVVPIINVDYFADPRHKVIYRTIIDHMEEMGGFKFDIVVYSQKLRKLGKFEQVGGASYLVELLEFVPSAASAMYYCELVKAGYEKRAVVAYGQEMVRTALDPTTDAHELAMSLCGKLEGVFSGKDDKGIEFTGIMDRAKELCEGSYIPAISTGFDCIDGFIGGYEPGGLTVIAARPSMGKTALAVQLMAKLAFSRDEDGNNAGLRSGMFSIEMPRKALEERLIAMASNRSTKELKERHKLGLGVHETEQELVMKAAQKIHDVSHNIWVDDSCGLTIDQIEMRMSQKQRNCDVLFVDHLGEISLKGDNLAFLRGDAVRRLRNLGKKHGHHTVLVAQLNRGNTARQDKRPYMSDLEGSGGIEQSADNIILVHREDYYHKHEQGYVNTDRAELIFDKSRGGETGVREMGWDGPHTKFIEY